MTEEANNLPLIDLSDDQPVELETNETKETEPSFLDDGLEPEQTQEEIEEELEIERNGKKYKIPKALENELLMQADYTRKTQELADNRRALEAERQQTNQLQELYQHHANSIAKVSTLNDQITDYEKVDWNALSEQDPQLAQKHWINFSNLKDQRQAIVNEIYQAENQRAAIVTQQQEKAFADCNAELRDPKNGIPNWNLETATELMNYAEQTYGIPPDRFNAISNPKTVKGLYKSMMNERAIAEKLAQAKQPVAKEPETILPTKTISGKAPATGKPWYALEDDEWRKHRNKATRKR